MRQAAFGDQAPASVAWDEIGEPTRRRAVLHAAPITDSLQANRRTSAQAFRKMTFTHKIVIAMAAGIGVGAAIAAFGDPDVGMAGFLVVQVFDPVGRVFVTLLQMMVVPLVLTSLVTGVTALGDMRAIGRLGLKTLGLYLLTTAVALVIALTVARTLSPGGGFELAGDVDFEVDTPPSLSDVLVGMFPSNPVQALADGQMLQIIVFALFFGFAIGHCGKAGERVAQLFADVNEVVMRMVLIVIATAPVGVFALLAETFARQGIEVLQPLAGYFGTVVLCLLLHLVVTYSTLIRLAGLSPLRFFGKMRAVMTFAFSTSSSSATIPVTLSTVEKRLGADNRIAAFTVPLGATINMDGTALYLGIVALFTAQAFGYTLEPHHYGLIAVTAALVSIGAAGIPSASLFLLATVLQVFDVSPEHTALVVGFIFPFDRLLDMMRTVVNVTGDATVATTVAKWEGEIDEDIFRSRATQ